MWRLLLVDDHEPFRRAARALLEAEGFAVVGEAGTGAEALERVTELEPDVVLLDVQLPDMSGFQVAERLGEPHPPIVLVSSRPASEYRQRLTTTSAIGFIAKEDVTGAVIDRMLQEMAAG